MKILTRTKFDKIDRYLAEAALLLRKAEVVCRNAHRSWWPHCRIACALNDVKRAQSEIEKGWRNGYLVPPRTRKVLRMERNERERFTMGGPSRAQGARDSLPADGCPPEGKEPTKVKE